MISIWRYLDDKKIGEVNSVQEAYEIVSRVRGGNYFYLLEENEPYIPAHAEGYKIKGLTIFIDASDVYKLRYTIR